jgi:hypothetical protein
MTRPASENASDAATPATLLEEVEGLLARQLEHVQRGQTDAAYQVGRQMADLMPKVQAAGLAADPVAAARLRRLYDALALALTQQMAELSEKRSRLGRQRKSVRAYRRAEPPRNA